MIQFNDFQNNPYLLLMGVLLLIKLLHYKTRKYKHYYIHKIQVKNKNKYKYVCKTHNHKFKPRLNLYTYITSYFFNTLSRFIFILLSTNLNVLPMRKIDPQSMHVIYCNIYHLYTELIIII